MALKQFTIDFQELSIDPKVGLKDYSPLYKNGVRLKNFLLNQNIQTGIKSGRTPSRFNEDYWNGENEFLTMSDVDILTFSINPECADKITDFAIEKEKTLYQTKGNTLIISNAMTLGLSFLTDRPVFINQNVFEVNLNEAKINKKFVLWYFNLVVRPLFQTTYTSKYLSKDELGRIKIPNISKHEQDQIAAQIEPIEQKIKDLKKQIKEPQEVINKVFAREFGFDIENVNKVEQEKYLFVSNDITYQNLNLRTSVRWNKIAPIQKVVYKNNPYIKKLGKYIVSTKNGWSPTCRETDTEYFVFGVNSISKNSTINFDDLKTSNQQKTNIEEYYTKNDDLFVSRGNTVDLVALASVVKNLPEDKNIVFPDLFIRIELNEKELIKEYLALLFNSIIGRFYFKYSAKGKNQTMVKVSADELNNFYLPIPPLKIQQKIVDEIKAELDKQEEIKQQIEQERNKIDKIVENAIV